MRKFSRIMLTLFVFTTFLANAQVNEELPDLNVSFQQNTYEDSAAIAAVPAPVEIDRNAWDYKLRERMKPLVAEAKRSKFTTGICVYDLTGDSMLYEFNSQKLFRPASTQKLLTSISALDKYGKDGEYKTCVYVDGRITHDQVMKINERIVLEDHYSDTLGEIVKTEIIDYDTTYVYKDVLHGNIYVKGMFDPLFTTDDFHELVKAIGKLNFEEIDGELIGDVSMKDSLVFGKGWCWDDMPSSFAPWLSPLLFNEGIRLNSKADVYMKDPDTYFLDNLVSELASLGKEIRKDQVRLSFQRTNAEKGHRVFTKTRTIEDVLQRMMKKSNNQFAESMFYLLGYDNGSLDHPTTADDCAEQIRTVMQKAGCKEVEETKIADGSGLSIYDYVTAENEVLMLRYAYHNKHIYKPLYESLPIAGVDGTIKTRMKTGSAYKNVRAKTGTLSGVSTLAGYVKASNGNMLAFSIMNNGVSLSAVGTNYQDKLCQALAK